MIILVIDVAAEHGGALTVLNQFIDEFKKNKANHYIVVLSTLHYENCANIAYHNCKWVKKSHLYRLFFDKFYIKELIKKYQPDRLLSLQNNAFPVDNIPQDVFFHNALPIANKRFSLFESRSLWIYQNIVGGVIKQSLKNASRIIVQANWIKQALISKWHIEEKNIIVKRPCVMPSMKTKEYHPRALFYPANGGLYKNHITLIKALVPLWKKYGGPELRLTGEMSGLPLDCQKILNNREYPIKFLGRLSKEQMNEQYVSTILVFPSYIETVGLPLIEAKDIGSKIIVSDCEYAHEAIDKYDNVDYFGIFNNEKLTELIKKTCIQFGILR